MHLMNFYIEANQARELILSMTFTSKKIFEISLNTSLITDDLSQKGESLKSYQVYTDGIIKISKDLEELSQEQMKIATSIMETSLEKTKNDNWISKINEAKLLIKCPYNLTIIDSALDNMLIKNQNIFQSSKEHIQQLKQVSHSIKHVIKKLWLINTCLQAQMQQENIIEMIFISEKINEITNICDETLQLIYHRTKVMEKLI